jgi:hypothetical protein
MLVKQFDLFLDIIAIVRETGSLSDLISKSTQKPVSLEFFNL